MLPSLVAREIHNELAHYLLSRFPVSTPAFNGADGMGGGWVVRAGWVDAAFFV